VLNALALDGVFMVKKITMESAERTPFAIRTVMIMLIRNGE